MDKTNNLQYFLTDIADAIREKKGTSDLINAQNFADEIKNMTTAGGGEGGGGESGSGGGSDVIYIDMRGYENFTYPSIFSDCVKLIKDEQTVWMPGCEYVQSPNDAISPIAICVYTNKKISYGSGQPIGQLLTYGELITMMGLGAVMELPRITEEEFYNLNA